MFKIFLISMLSMSCQQKVVEKSAQPEKENNDSTQKSCLTSSNLGTVNQSQQFTLQNNVTYSQSIHTIGSKKLQEYVDEVVDQDRISKVPLVAGIVVESTKYKLEFKNLPEQTYRIHVRWLPMNTHHYRPFITLRKNIDFDSGVKSFVTKETFDFFGSPLIEVLVEKDLETPLTGILYYADLSK